MGPVLAKSAAGGRSPRTLAEHTHDVVEAFGALFGKPGQPTRLGDRWVAFFRVIDVAAFLWNGLAAAWLHDWGKANDGFQAMLRGQGKQLIRHEYLSALLLQIPSVKTWLSRRADLDLDVIVATVATHHLQASYEAIGKPRIDTDVAMHVQWEEPSFQALLGAMASELRLPWPAKHDVETLWSFQPQLGDRDLPRLLYELKVRLDDFDCAIDADEPRRRMLWAVRAAVIAADAAGSALIRDGHSISQWIGEAFDPSTLLDGEAIRANVIEPRVRDLTERGMWQRWNDFQLSCDDLPDRALLLAPCGSGKTLAAWRWIAARLDANRAARVIFLYPTRGSATEGFRDYVSWAPEADAALVHGTSTYELDGLFDNVEDDPRSSRVYESNAKLFALRQWPKRIFSATVDQFLGFLQYGYAPMCHLPLLADSVVVVDEVHSFDRGMFSALRNFLEAFDIPVLCMTATLPAVRRLDLETCGLAVHPRRMSAHLRLSAEYPRYLISRIGRDDVGAQVRRALADGGRVLWVANTVARAQTATRELAADPDAEQLTVGDAPLFCYHSRFRLEDRKRQHDAVVTAFRRSASGSGAVLAITTQVCEMSLDLDADVLVTEEAPVTALIQRMGRCCREPLPHDGRHGEVLVYETEDDKPYTPEQMAGVKSFVERLSGGARVSQAQLEAALALAPSQREVPKASQFLDSGPWAMASDDTFRDIEQWTRASVLPEDVCDFERLRRSRTASWKADGLVLPVPVHLAKGRDRRLPGYLFVADAGHYSTALGYLDKPRQQKPLIV